MEWSTEVGWIPVSGMIPKRFASGRNQGLTFSCHVFFTEINWHEGHLQYWSNMGITSSRQVNSDNWASHTFQNQSLFAVGLALAEETAASRMNVVIFRAWPSRIRGGLYLFHSFSAYPIHLHDPFLFGTRIFFGFKYHYVCTNLLVCSIILLDGQLLFMHGSTWTTNGSKRERHKQQLGP